MKEVGETMVFVEVRVKGVGDYYVDFSIFWECARCGELDV